MDALAARIQTLCRLQGTFTLRSGRTATEYFDKSRFEAAPEILEQIAERMVPLIPAGTEVLAALELGGVPVGTLLSHFFEIAACVRTQSREAIWDRALV